MTGAPITVVELINTEDRKKLERVFPLVEARGGGVEDLARAAGVAVDIARRALDDPDTAALLLDEQARAEDEGALLKPMAARLTATMLRHLVRSAEAGELDVDDVGSLLPKVHRIVEHSDRMSAAQASGYENLPTFVINFISGRMTGHVVAADVVDAEPYGSTTP